MNENYLQYLMNGIFAHDKEIRATQQLTLGGLIAALEAMPEGAEVANLEAPHSYRGYYDDLAFERDEGMRPAVALLEDCRKCMGQVFCGYKGGDFVMGAKTPLWVANYGDTGVELLAINPDGTLITGEEHP